MAITHVQATGTNPKSASGLTTEKTQKGRKTAKHRKQNIPPPENPTVGNAPNGRQVVFNRYA